VIHHASAGRLARAWTFFGAVLTACALSSPAAATQAQYDATCGSGGGCHASPPDNGRRNAANQASFITWAAGGGVGSMVGVDTTNAASIASYIESVYNTSSISRSVPFQTATAIDLSGYVMFGQTSGLDRFVYGGLSVAEGTISPASNVATGSETITFTPAACRTGAASFTYYATNGGGNPTTSTRTVNVTIGNPSTGPTVTSGGTMSGQTGVAISPYTFTVAACPSLVTSYTLQSGSLPSGLALSSGVISGTPAVGTVGTYPVTVRVSYQGGAFTDKLVTITITLGPPIITSGAPPTGIEGTAYAGYTITASNTPIVSYAASGLPAGLSINTLSGAITGTPTATSDPPFSSASIGYPVTISATNATGTTNQGVTFTIGAKPTVTSAATASGQTGVPFSYQVTATKSPTSYAATPLPPGLSISPATGVISGTPTVVGGPTAVSVTATNATGTSATFNLGITIGLGPPVITSGLMPGGGEAIIYPGYQITATNPPHTSFNATGLPAGLSIDTTTGAITGTPAAATGGSYPVTIFATNATATASSARTLNISSIAPVINSALSASGQTGAPFSYQITAANAPTSFAASPLPPGLSFNPSTGVISGTPTAVGSTNVSITASNGSGFDTKTLAITITLGPPVITSGTTASGAAGFAFTYQITATNAPTSFGATGLPPGVSVSPTTGAITGAPTANGIYNATVSATNTTATANLAVTITIAVGIPAINSSATASGSTGVPFVYQITATNGPTSFGATGLPAGLSLDAATGIISGLPDLFGTFNVNLTASNATGMGSRALTLTILQSPPGVTSSATAAAAVGQLFQYVIAVANGPALITATGLPPGLTLDEPNSRIYGTPTAGGTFPVAISISNSVGTTNFTLTITIGFQIPSVQDLVAEVTYEEPRAIALAVTGQYTRIDVTVLPNHGIVTIAGNVATYTPAIGYSGEDSFKYTASNPAGTSTAATVRITVSTLSPTGTAAAMTVTLNTPATADLRPFIKGSGLSGVSIGTQAVHGSVTVDGTRVTYTPRTDFFGKDSFTYIAYGNAGASPPATVTVSVVGRPDPTLDGNVAGVVDAQAQAARRFASAQAGNYQRRMESLHRAPPPQRNAEASPVASVAAVDPPSKPLRAVSPSLMPVGLVMPLVDAVASRSLDVSGSTPVAGLATGTNVWIGGTAQFGRRDADGTVSGLRFSSDGVSIGIDRRFGERLALGLGVGFGRDETDIGSGGSRSKAKGASFAFYGSFQPSATTFIDALLGFGKLDFDSSRHVAAIDAFAVGSRKGDQAFASLAAGAEFRRDGLLVSPYGRFDLSADRLKQYGETGVGDYALSFHGQNLRSTQLAMGVRVESQHDTEFGRAVPRARIEYRRELQDERAATVSYADLFAGPEYTLTRTGTSRNALLLGVGSDFLLRGGLKIGLDYQAQRASGSSNVQGVRLLVSQELDGKGFASWSWQPTMFKDPVSLEAGYTFDDNVTRGRADWEKLADRVYSLSVGQPIAFKLGSLTKMRLVLTPSLGGEKFNRNAGLGRSFAGAQAELQYRASGAFDATTYALVGRAHYDEFESSHRTGARYFLGVNARRAITDRIDVFAEIGANARNGRSDVFTTRDYAAKLNLDYSLGKRGILYLAGEYRRGDTVSSGRASLLNVGISEVFVPDDAFESHDFFAYRFDARTVLGTVGWNYPLGPRDSLDLSWRRVQSTPTQRPAFDGGALRYIDNQYSLIYLMRF